MILQKKKGEVTLKPELISSKSIVINPKILYYGTPVILLNTLNSDNSTNISPISSSWALGDYIILGIGTGGKAFENLEAHRECVINIPNPILWENVERLALSLVKILYPTIKKNMGFPTKRINIMLAGSLQ